MGELLSTKDWKARKESLPNLAYSANNNRGGGSLTHGSIFRLGKVQCG